MIEINFLDPIFNWEALAATGTLLSAIVALGIAFFSFWQTHKQEKQFHMKEAVEKLVVPMRKELDGFSKTKWDLWYVHNRWHLLRDRKNDLPLQYYSLKNANSKLIKKIESFDSDFYRFTNFDNNSGVSNILRNIISETFRSFVKGNIVVTGNAGNLPNDDGQIINSHGRGHAGDDIQGVAVVTLYSLVFWKASLSDFLNDRKVKKENIVFALGDLEFSPKLDVELTDKLLSEIELRISESNKADIIKEYRQKWANLYQKGSGLIRDIESWYGSI